MGIVICLKTYIHIMVEFLFLEKDMGVHLVTRYVIKTGVWKCWTNLQDHRKFQLSLLF